MLHASQVTSFFGTFEKNDVEPIINGILDEFFETQAENLKDIELNKKNIDIISKYLARGIFRTIKKDPWDRQEEDEKIEAVIDGLKSVKLDSNNKKLVKNDGSKMRVKDLIRMSPR